MTANQIESAFYMANNMYLKHKKDIAHFELNWETIELFDAQGNLYQQVLPNLVIDNVY